MADVPLSPIDLDLPLLARSEWDVVKDRFRMWFLPKIEDNDDVSLCYVTVRKLDQEQGVLVCTHIVVNLRARTGDDSHSSFTVGILSNDDIRARSILGTILGIPPVFHKRSEITLIERRWRSDPETLARFTANAVSAVVARLEPDGKVHGIRA